MNGAESSRSHSSVTPVDGSASSGASAPGALNVTSPGREYANRSSGRAAGT